MLVSKRLEKPEKNARSPVPNASSTREILSILHYALGKNASQLRFFAFLLAYLLTNLTKMQTQRIV